MRVLHGSLLARVLASNLALATGTVLGLVSLFLWSYSRDLERQIASRAGDLAEFLAGQSQFAMLVGDTAELERIARTAVSSDAVLFVEFTEVNGAYVSLGQERQGSPAAWRRSIEVTRPVLRPAQVAGIGWEAPAEERPAARLGTVRLGFSTEREYSARVRIGWVTAGTAIACLLIAAGVLTVQLRTLLQPLKSLTDFTRRVAAGDLTGRAEVARSDEVGRLTMAFNTMVERLGATLVSKEAAEAADAAKGRFLATMSHELRTPLNAIIGYSQLVQETCQERRIEGLEPDLKRIERAGGILLEMVNKVLDYSKTEAGKIELDPETFDVRAVIQDVMGTVAPLAAKRRNRLSVTVGEHAATVHADLARFRQSLLNLVANACKFTEEGEVSVEASRRQSGEADWIVVSVRDTGIGIGPDLHGKLFQAFTQGDPSTTRKYGGSGLGLAISRKMCRMMGGDISVESELGKGSTFTMWIPARCAAPDSGQEDYGTPRAIAAGG